MKLLGILVGLFFIPLTSFAAILLQQGVKDVELGYIGGGRNAGTQQIDCADVDGTVDKITVNMSANPTATVSLRFNGEDADNTVVIGTPSYNTEAVFNFSPAISCVTGTKEIWFYTAGGDVTVMGSQTINYNNTFVVQQYASCTGVGVCDMYFIIEGTATPPPSPPSFSFATTTDVMTTSVIAFTSLLTFLIGVSFTIWIFHIFSS